jgi:tRNA uridine 5-carboxymethylaminomethyl modification enzyme
MAGINAVRGIQSEPSIVLDRSQAYIGVLIDDLVTKGTLEPYRMMTSRAEYRLLLRQDNADMRLTEIGYAAGLASRDRYVRTLHKTESVEAELRRLKDTIFPPSARLNEWLMAIGTPPIRTGLSGYDLLKRPQVTYAALLALEASEGEISEAAAEQVEIQAKYEGYIEKQRRQAEQFKRMEHRPLPEDLNYEQITGLRLEARQKLKALRPSSVGQASRISGVSPSDVSVLLIYLEKRKREEN